MLFASYKMSSGKEEWWSLSWSFNLDLLSAINRGDVKDTEIERMMDTIVESLFCVFVTLGEWYFTFCPLCCYIYLYSTYSSGQVPIIRCPRNNAAEMVAEKLDKKLRDNIRDTRNSLFTADNLHSGQFR